MAVDIARLRINKIIAHEFYKRNDDNSIPAPVYSDSLLELDDRINRVISDRLVSALGRGSKCIEMIRKSDMENPVFELVKNAFSSSDSDFISISRNILDKLVEAQNDRRPPGGILFVIKGISGLNDIDFIAIVKSELQDGLLKNTRANKVSIEFINDLLMAKGQKLYKIAFYTKLGQEYKIHVFDQIMSTKDEKQPARYFYSDFLRCEQAPSDRAKTRKLYTETKQFIKESDLPIERKVELHNSLISYLKLGNNQIISIGGFSDDFIRPAEKEKYDEFFSGSDIKDHSFNRNTEDIKTFLRVRSIKFSSNIRISANYDDYKEHVRIIEQNDDFTKLEIDGRIIEP